VYLYAYSMIMFWTTPPAALSPELLLGATATPWRRATPSTSRAARRPVHQPLFAGDELGELSRDQDGYAKVIKKLRQALVINWHEPYQQIAHNLREDMDDATKLPALYDEADRLPAHIAAKDLSALLNYYYCKASSASCSATSPARSPRYRPISADSADDHRHLGSPWAFLSGVVVSPRRAGRRPRSGSAPRDRDRAARQAARVGASLPGGRDHKLALLERR